MKTVISANYKDRDNKTTPWLTRFASQGTTDARPVRSLHATKVRFRSSDIESGFGCNLVAESDADNVLSVVDSIPVPAFAEPLTFTGSSFLAGGKYVEEVDALHLLPDGKMMVVVSFPKAIIAQAVERVNKAKAELDSATHDLLSFSSYLG